MRQMSKRTPGLNLSSQWKTFVLSPNKFLSRPRSNNAEGISRVVADLGVVLSIKFEDGQPLRLDNLDDFPYNTQVATR